jgi:hypothetical protein
MIVEMSKIGKYYKKFIYNGAKNLDFAKVYGFPLARNKPAKPLKKTF